MPSSSTKFNYKEFIHKMDEKYNLLFEKEKKNTNIYHYAYNLYKDSCNIYNDFEQKTKEEISFYENIRKYSNKSLHDLSKQNLNTMYNEDEFSFFTKKLPNKIPKEIKNVNITGSEINHIQDLIDLLEKYPLSIDIKYNINIESLHKIKSELNELNNMIGIKDMKENVIDQILYFIQDLHKVNEKSGDFMHTVIYGPPGTGKTEIAKIIGRIFCKLGILKNGVFKKVTRSDLIAGYLGQTSIKTKDVINECLGGVLFIDEAYALGNSEKRDSFSKECIDTLCEALSNYKDELMVIIAGYENELQECFFSYNQGLDSRFTWRFKTEEYKYMELYQIFLKKVNECGWSIEEKSKINAEWFENKMVYFKFFGRDVETFLSKIKIVHSRRVFCDSQSEKTKITFADLEKGFELFLKNNEVKKRKENLDMNTSLMSIYV